MKLDRTRLPRRFMPAWTAAPAGFPPFSLPLHQVTMPQCLHLRGGGQQFC